MTGRSISRAGMRHIQAPGTAVGFLFFLSSDRSLPHVALMIPWNPLKSFLLWVTLLWITSKTEKGKRYQKKRTVWTPGQNPGCFLFSPPLCSFSIPFNAPAAPKTSTGREWIPMHHAQGMAIWGVCLAILRQCLLYGDCSKTITIHPSHGGWNTFREVKFPLESLRYDGKDESQKYNRTRVFWQNIQFRFRRLWWSGDTAQGFNGITAFVLCWGLEFRLYAVPLMGYGVGMHKCCGLQNVDDRSICLRSFSGKAPNNQLFGFNITATTIYVLAIRMRGGEGMNSTTLPLLCQLSASFYDGKYTRCWESCLCFEKMFEWTRQSRSEWSLISGSPGLHLERYISRLTWSFIAMNIWEYMYSPILLLGDHKDSVLISWLAYSLIMPRLGHWGLPFRE